MKLDINKINQKFKSFGQIIVNYRWLILVLFAILVGASVVGLSGLEKSASNDNWYFKDDPMIVMKEKFEETFSNTDICVLHIKDNNIFTHHNLQKIDRLTKELQQKVPLIKNVVSLTNVEYISGTKSQINIGKLISGKIPQSKTELKSIKDKALSTKVFRNRLVSDDGKETLVIVHLQDYPGDWKTNESYLSKLKIKKEKYNGLYSGFDLSNTVAPNHIVGVIVKKIANQEKYNDLQIKTTGVPIVTNDKRVFFQKETKKLLLLGLLISILVLGVFLRSIRGVVFPIVTAMGAMVITLGIEGHLGTTIEASMISVPLFLGLAVAIGYSIHVFNFYKQKFSQTGKRKEAVVFAIEKTGWPLLFTALTTIFALMSFQFIEIRVLEWVGSTCALIVGITYLLVLIIFPILLSFGKNKENNLEAVDQNNTKLADMLANLEQYTLNHSKIIITIFVIFTLLCGYGLTKMEVNLDQTKTMGRKIPYVDRVLSIAETKLGIYSSYNIAIEFPNNNAAKNPKNLHKLNKFIKKVESFPLTKRTTSVLNRLKEINRILHAGKDKYYRVPKTKEMIAQDFLLYEGAGGDKIKDWVDFNYKKLRIRVGVNDYESKEMLEEHKKIKELGREMFPKAEVSVIGSLAQFTDMTMKVAWGQIKAFLISLSIITVLMMIVFGSVKVGLIGLIPNITPALTVGGIMGIFGIPLDMITSTIMPMLMGLAVDDTIHFINHAKYEYQQEKDYSIAIQNTFRSVGKSLFMTSVVLSLNFAIYTISVANLYVHFGILTIAGIMAALLADFLVTPVCLNVLSPFGEE